MPRTSRWIPTPPPSPGYSVGAAVERQAGTALAGKPGRGRHVSGLRGERPGLPEPHRPPGHRRPTSPTWRTSRDRSCATTHLLGHVRYEHNYDWQRILGHLVPHRSASAPWTSGAARWASPATCTANDDRSHPRRSPHAAPRPTGRRSSMWARMPASPWRSPPWSTEAGTTTAAGTPASALTAMVQPSQRWNLTVGPVVLPEPDQGPVRGHRAGRRGDGDVWSALPVRAAPPDHAVHGDAAEPHLHAQALLPALRPALHRERGLPDPWGHLDTPGGYTFTPWTGHAPDIWTSTTARCGAPRCCAGSGAPAPRCTWRGNRAGRTRPPALATSTSPATGRPCSMPVPTMCSS